ncbi:MAG: hypothetical protein H0Z40_12020 [Desulfotomaculum sp.]|nr:hypothetical protein [Desulfotomaculum sp.]MBO8138824.1 hypothetical protein [Desulfotomaculum sp.]
MRLVSFDPFRSTGIPNVTYVKPELIFKEKELIKNCDWVLFPQYWQVNLLHYAWKKRIFPSINSYHLGHDKVEITRALQALVPGHVPYTLITANTPGIEDKILEEFSFPFVAKKVRSSMGKGVYLIENIYQLKDYLDKNQVVYIQEYLPINRDLRVVYVGNRVICAYWRIGQGSFTNNVAQGSKIDFSSVPRKIIDLVEKTASSLGINHAGFDLAVVNDRVYFFEFNVLFGNQALNQAGISVNKFIYNYITNETPVEPEPPKPLLPTGKAS